MEDNEDTGTGLKEQKDLQDLNERLANLINQPTNIGGWRLIQTNANEEENIYKFRKETIIYPSSSITVWSNDSGKVLNLPTDIVMKKQHWSSGNKIKTPTDITGWRLIQTNENEEENMYKFRKETLIDPGCSITIWSNDSGKVTNLPTDIVMKKQHWSSGNEIRTLLFNSNFLPTNIGGWRIIQTNANQEENIFKFRKDTIIHPSCSITVWSNDAGKVTNLPTDFVRKKQRWSSGDEIKTILINSSFLEVSTFQISSCTKEGKELD